MNDSRQSSRMTWRRGYAFGLVWLAVFAAASALLHEPRCDFRAVASLKYRVDRPRLDAESLDRLLRDAAARVVREVDRAAVGGGENGAHSAEPVRPPFSVRRIDHADSVELIVSRRGTGDVSETREVNRVAHRLSVEIPADADRLFVARWLQRCADGLDLTRQIHLAEQIRNELDAVRERLAHAGQSVSAIAEDSPEPSVELGLMSRNPFFTASVRRSAPSADLVPAPADAVAIDWTVVDVACEQLRRDAENALATRRELNAELAAAFAAASDRTIQLTALDFSPRPRLDVDAYRAPAGVLWIATLIAAGVALAFDPIRDRGTLRRLADVERYFGATIVGCVSALPPRRTAFARRCAAGLVRTSEVLVLLVAIVLAAALVAQPGTAATLCEHPLYAWAHWFSLLRF